MKVLSVLDWKLFYEIEVYLCFLKYVVLYYVINMKVFGKYKIYFVKLKVYNFFKLINEN